MKQSVCELCWLLRPLLMLFVVSSALCNHLCVSMHVSSWWRAVSVLAVYAAGKCDPSPAEAVAQVPEHSLTQSSPLTFLSLKMATLSHIKHTRI